MQEKTGINYSDLYQANRSLVVKILMKKGECPRMEIARETGLSQAAITRITSELIDSGIVLESGAGKGDKGRRTICLKLNTDLFWVIGIKIGRKDFSIGVFDLACNLLEYTSTPRSQADEPLDVLQNIAAQVNALITKYPQIKAAGASVPGPYLREKGIISKMTSFPGWKEINLKKYFAEHVPIPVLIEHDANAGALYEWWFGGFDTRSLINVIVSEGVGAGIIYDGNILYGRHGIAGEIGHTSIVYNGRKCECAPDSRGCLEKYCSAMAFMNDVQAEIGKAPESILNTIPGYTIDDVFNAAREGDGFAERMVRQLGFYLGVGLANAVNQYDPEIIVISDVIAKAGEKLLESVKETMKQRLIPEVFEDVRICFSSRKEHTSLYGAGSIAIDYYLNKPMADMTLSSTVG